MTQHERAVQAISRALHELGVTPRANDEKTRKALSSEIVNAILGAVREDLRNQVQTMRHVQPDSTEAHVL